MSLTVDIRKDYGDFHLSLSMQAEAGVIGILGASGSGKSVTLRCVAGIEQPDSGRIALNGHVLFDSEKHINLPPQKRRVGYLFQQYALFPTMTVEQNILAGARNMPKEKRAGAVSAMIEKMQLSGLGKKYPRQLSGGQQQRTALARILINEPDVLLLDEPFSALDSHLRDSMEREVMEVIRDFAGPVLLVSHSRDEIYRMADNIAVIHNGRIDAYGEKHAVFRSPGTLNAARLTGCKNFSSVSNLRHENGQTLFTADDWGLPLCVSGTLEGNAVGIRRHYAVLAESPGKNTFEMDICDVIEDPFEYIVMLRLSGSHGKAFEWAVSKEQYRALPAGPLLIRIPEGAVMLLKA